ncbi:hypothetical protein D3C87_482300 [compost metagenome]
MASLISSMAKEIFQTLKGSGRTLSLFDEHGNKVFEPESALSFFAEPDKLMVSINSDGSNSALNMYISDSTDVDTMKKMIDTMRNTATRFNYLFNIRKYGKDLNPKDFAFKATPMMESMWGSAKTSYQTIGSAKLIVRHSSRISEEVRGARSRRIHSIFVETANGERFRCPMNSLHGARAFAKHLDAGGSPTDEFSTYIFAECDMQGTINRVRRHIRSIKEASEEVTSLAEALQGIVGASKNRISRSKGNRFYTGIVEQITNAPNHVGPLASEIAEQVAHLQDLLGIDETNSLFPILESVAKTLLETKQMDPINFEEETLLQTYMFEDEQRTADLIESLVGEFGFEEGVHFERFEANGVAMLSEEAFDGATMYLQGFDGFTLQETAQDKFTQYATQWLGTRFKKAGMDAREIEQADLGKQATELATGLKQIVAGALSVKVKPGATPRFANQAAAIAYKLDKLLAPGSGLGNDALWNFVSTISDKIGHGDALDANERFFAQRLADIVDKASVAEEAILPEMNELEEWIGQFDEARFSIDNNPYDLDAEERYVAKHGSSMPSQEQFERTVSKFKFADFIADRGSDLEGYESGQYKELPVEDRTYSRNYITDMVAGYLAHILDIDVHDLSQYEYQIDDLVDDVVPALEQLGFVISLHEDFDLTVFESDLDEAEGGMNPAIKELVVKALSEIDSGDFYGIVSGDDADDDLYQLLHALKAHIANDLDLTDYAEEIKQMAYTAWTQDWNKNEAIEEAGNYPDDYNDARNPHSASGPGDEIDGEVVDAIHDVVANPPEGSDLAKVTAEWFDGESDEDLFNDLVSDVLHFAAREVDRSHDDEVGTYYIKDYEAEFTKLAYSLLKKKFSTVTESDIDEDRNAVRDSARLSTNQLLRTVPSFVKREQNPTVDSVFAAMEEFYMDSRTMGPLLYTFADKVKDAIAKAIGVTTESDEAIAGADQGDDFIQDITYKSDGNDEAEHIARLRKLAGI